MMFFDRSKEIINNFIEIAGGQPLEEPKRMGNQIIITMTKGKENDQNEKK